jgi:predicted RNA-binding Zn ribbon-like protein
MVTLESYLSSDILLVINKMSEVPKPFEFVAGALCLDFVNTVGSHGFEQAREKLSTYSDLVRWTKEASLIDDGKTLELLAFSEANPGGASKVLEEASEFRETLFRIFGGLQRKQSPNPSDLAALNETLRKFPIRLEVRSQGDNFCCSREIAQITDEWPLAPVAWSAADLLVSDQVRHVRQCADATCGWLFVDTSKNHSRRWCSMGDCGSQAKARRYYQRKKKMNR